MRRNYGWFTHSSIKPPLHVQGCGILLTNGMRDFNARLAEKLHLPEDDLRVELSARLVFAILGAASVQWRVSPNRSPSSAIAKEALRMFEKQKVLIPRKARRR